MNHARMTVLAALMVLAMMTAGASAHDLRPGEAVVGETPGAAAENVFDIHLAAGDAVRFSMKARGPGDCAPAVEITDPRGAPVAAESGERRMKLFLTAAMTGTYRIRLIADENCAPRFIFKVVGEAKRTYESDSGSVDFGAPAGAVVKVRVKSNTSAGAGMADSRGQEVGLTARASGRTWRARSGALAVTDDYRLDFDPAGSAKVKVRYPAPRGDIRLSLTRSSSPAGANPHYIPDSEPRDDDDEGGDDGSATDGAGDVIVVVPPAPLIDYRAVLAILRDEAQPDLDAARARLAGWDEEGAALLADLLAGEIDDPIMNDIRASIARHDVGGERAGPVALDAMLEIVDARRRADRARSRLDALMPALVGTALDGNPEMDAALANADAAIAELDGAVVFAVEIGLVATLRGDEGIDGPPLAASDDPGPSTENITALAALDAAVLSTNVMTRARGPHAASIDLAQVLYETYDAMIAANPAALANPVQTQFAIQQARAELAAIADALAAAPVLDLSVEEMPMVLQDEAYELLVKVAGDHDALLMEWTVEEPHGLQLETGPSGLSIRAEGHFEARTIVVRASDHGVEGRLEIEVAPRPAEMPRHGLRGRISDEAGNAIAGAAYEVREGVDGRIAASMAIPPRLLHGESNAEGRLIVNDLPEGEWVLVINAPGHREKLVPLTVEENADPSEVDIHEFADIVLEAE